MEVLEKVVRTLQILLSVWLVFIIYCIHSEVRHPVNRLFVPTLFVHLTICTVFVVLRNKHDKSHFAKTSGHIEQPSEVETTI